MVIVRLKAWMLREKSYSRTLCHLVTDLQTMHILELNMAVALAGLP